MNNLSLGLVGKKVGMTRIFTEEGASRPVSVVEASPNRVTQVKTGATDGYDAVQVTAGSRRAGRVGRAMRGHFARAGVEPGRGVWEFRLGAPSEHAAGAELTVEIFSAGQKVDVTGRSIGKGFAGVIKRHGFRGGRATHGNSKAHRLGGSIGNAQDPGRVFKGKKMAGHMGARRRVQQGLEVLRVDAARNLLLISGSIPGARGDDVIVRPSVKNKKTKAGAPKSDAKTPAKNDAKAAPKKDAKSAAKNEGKENAPKKSDDAGKADAKTAAKKPEEAAKS